MKEKLEELRKTIKVLLDESGQLIEAGKLEDAKTKQAEAKKKTEEMKVLKTQIEASEDVAKTELEIKAAQLEKEKAELIARAKVPVRLPFDDGTPGDDGAAAKSFTTMKYGEMDAAVKAVLADLYGVVDYNEAREEQMKAFIKYIRRGDGWLNAKEQALLAPSAKTIMLVPEVVKSEIMAGRTVAEIKATLEEGSNDLGGFLVPEDYRTEIIKRLMGLTVVRGRARVVTTTRDSVEWPRLEGGNSLYTSAVRVTWISETPANASAAATNPTFGLQRIPIHTVMARTNLSRNLLEDSAFNLLDVMAGLYAEAMAIDEDNQFLTGSGAGRPYGVLGDLGTGAQNVPVAGINLTVTGDASLVTADGFVNLVYSLHTQYRQGASFAMARLTQRDIRKLKDGEGRYIWQPGLQLGQPATLMGFPVYESENMPAIAVNNYPVIYGNWGAGYIIADRVGMTIERVVDSTTVGQNQVALFARRRLGGQVVAPWAFSAMKVSAT